MPSLGAAGGAAEAPTSGVKNPPVGAPDARGLNCRRLRKFGTSDADDRGIGPGETVACRDVRCDVDLVELLGGSGNTKSIRGGAPGLQGQSRHATPSQPNNQTLTSITQTRECLPKPRVLSQRQSEVVDGLRRRLALERERCEQEAVCRCRIQG